VRVLRTQAGRHQLMATGLQCNIDKWTIAQTEVVLETVSEARMHLRRRVTTIEELVEVIAYIKSVPKIVQKQVRSGTAHAVRSLVRGARDRALRWQRTRANALLKMASSLDEFRYKRQRDGMTALFTAIIYINDLLTAVDMLTKTSGSRRAELATEMLAQQVAFTDELDKIAAEVKTFESVEGTKNSKELVIQADELDRRISAGEAQVRSTCPGSPCSSVACSCCARRCRSAAHRQNCSTVARCSSGSS
jgi:hypothetical protein